MVSKLMNPDVFASDVEDGHTRNRILTNDIPYTVPGPFLARIHRISKPFLSASPDDDGTSNTPYIRITVRFENLLDRDGVRPLQLSNKYRFDLNARSPFARLVAAFAGISPQQVATDADKLDIDEFLDRPCSVKLRANPQGIASIANIIPLPIDALVDNTATTTAIAPVQAPEHVPNPARLLRNIVPPARPILPSRSPTGDNDVPYFAAGPFLARTLRFSSTFFETPEGKNVSAGTPNAIARARISVRFESIQGRKPGKPLELSVKYDVALDPEAEFAYVIAGLAGVDPEQLDAIKSDLDLDALVGKPVYVTLYSGPMGMARACRIAPIPLDAPIHAEPFDLDSFLIKARSTKARAEVAQAS
jgi:hypothetical protein